MLIKTNACNWSGDEVEVEVVDNKFELFGYEFNIEFKAGGTVLKVYGDEWGYALASGVKVDDCWTIEGGPVSRDNKNPFEAVIKVLCNII